MDDVAMMITGYWSLEHKECVCEMDITMTQNEWQTLMYVTRGNLHVLSAAKILTGHMIPEYSKYAWKI